MIDTRPISQNTKMLPCPFCGTIPTDVAINIDGTSAWQYVICHNDDCLCEGRLVGPHKDWDAGRVFAIMAWNTRHKITRKEQVECVNWSSSSQ